MTRRVKVACATITPSGSDEWKGHAAAAETVVKAGNVTFEFGQDSGAHRNPVRGTFAR